MNTTPEAIAALEKLRQEKKFVETEFYPGAPIEEIRSRCESTVNQFLDELVSMLRRGAGNEEAIARARILVDSFAEEDTEEREKVGDYIGDALRAVGLEDEIDSI